MDQATLDLLQQQMRRDEGVRYFPYQDSLGFWTIGIGHKVLPNESYSSAVALTDGQVDFIYNNDMQAVMMELSQLPWYAALDPVRQCACLNMGFNMGENRLLGFKCMESDLMAQNWQGAHDQALASEWAGQVGERAQRLATQLLTGEWQ